MSIISDINKNTILMVKDQYLLPYYIYIDKTEDFLQKGVLTSGAVFKIKDDYSYLIHTKSGSEVEINGITGDRFFIKRSDIIAMAEECSVNKQDTPMIHSDLKILAIHADDPERTCYVELDKLISYLWGKRNVSLLIMHNNTIVHTYGVAGGDVLTVYNTISKEMEEISKTIPNEYAFWRYSSFPYCLHSEVVDKLEDGKVQTKGYQGLLFIPFKILPYSEGKKLGEQLDEITGSYNKELEKFNSKYNEMVYNLIPELKSQKEK